MLNKRIAIHRVSLVREGSVPYPSPLLTQLRSSDIAAEVSATMLRDVDREHFLVFSLDRQNRIIAVNPAMVGGLSQCTVRPPEVFLPAILSRAANIICVHNHPSGYIQPSQADRQITTQIYAAGKLLDIPVLDHIIIGFQPDGSFTYWSFGDNGCLENL